MFLLIAFNNELNGPVAKVTNTIKEYYFFVIIHLSELHAPNPSPFGCVYQGRVL